MSESEKDRLVGKSLRELYATQRELARLNSKSRAMSEAMGAAIHRLDNPKSTSLPMPKELPTLTEIRDLLQAKEEAWTQVQLLRKCLRDMGYENV